MLSELKADEFILMGAVLEDAVKYTALGLLIRRKKAGLMSPFLTFRAVLLLAEHLNKQGKKLKKF